MGNAIAVEVASLNSSLLQQTPGVFQGHGYVSDGQLEFVGAALGWQRSDPGLPRAFRIVMLHHHVVPILHREVPVYERQSSVVYDAGALCRWIGDSEVDLVLHGHMHDPAVVREGRARGGPAQSVGWHDFTIAGLGSTGIDLAHTADNRNTYGILRFGRAKVGLELRQISPSGHIAPEHRTVMKVDIPYKHVYDR